MDIKAKARYVRISPRKIRLVLDAVRNLNPEKAVISLTLMPQKASRPVRKLIESAIANAENNFKLKKEDLSIKHLVADDGPTIKRWRARAFGRAAMIRKRTSHISVVLTDGKEEVVELDKKDKKETKKSEVADKSVKPDKPVKTEKTKKVEEKIKESKAKKAKKKEPAKKAVKKAVKK